jgi:hypothetical protein
LGRQLRNAAAVHMPHFILSSVISPASRPLPLPLVNAASVAGRLSSFEFPGTLPATRGPRCTHAVPSPADYDPLAIPSMDPTGFFVHPLPPGA